MFFLTRSSALTLILTILLCSLPLSAQEKETANSKQQDADLKAKAVSLLQSLAGQVGSLQSRENRVRISSNLAGSLWKHDEQRARALLAAVEEDIKLALQPLEFYDAADAHTYLVFLRLRTDTIRRIAAQDAVAALSFFKATTPENAKKLPHNARTAERALELELANQVAAQSPEVAIELARKSLSRGLSGDVVAILRKLARKDKDQARVLHKEILQQIKKTNFPRAGDEHQVASALVNSFVPPAADDATFREIVDLFITKAMNLGCDKGTEDQDRDCYWLGSIIATMETVDAGRARKLRRWADTPDAVSQSFIEMNDLTEARDVEGILALATRYPETEVEIYYRAVMTALAEDDIEKARKITSERVTDPDQRQYLLAQIERASGWHTIEDKDIAQLQRNLLQDPRIQVRAGMLLYTANKMAKPNAKVALKLLKQADDLIATMKPDKEQAKLLLTAASLYCLVKSDRGFEIMESLVPRFNELVDAAVKLNGFDTDYVRENEWNMSAAGHTGDALTMLARDAGYYAWFDFDRAVNLASQFDRNEIRMMAQLKLAQGILAGRPTRAPLMEM